jgi:hypothetical protein
MKIINVNPNGAGRDMSTSLGTTFLGMLAMIDTCIKIMVVHATIIRYLNRKREM